MREEMKPGAPSTLNMCLSAIGLEKDEEKLEIKSSDNARRGS